MSRVRHFRGFVEGKASLLSWRHAFVALHRLHGNGASRTKGSLDCPDHSHVREALEPAWLGIRSVLDAFGKIIQLARELIGLSKTPLFRGSDDPAAQLLYLSGRSFI